MSAWTSDELDRIGAAEELQITPRRDTDLLGKSVIVWVVRHGDDLYVRSVNGSGASWFRAALARHEALVRAGGVEREVGLVESDDVDDPVDDAYQAKYGQRYPTIVPSILAPPARETTLKLVPR